MPADWSVAITSCPREASHRASSPVPQLISRIRKGPLPVPARKALSRYLLTRRCWYPVSYG